MRLTSLLFLSIIALFLFQSCGGGTDQQTSDMSQFEFNPDNGGITLPDGFSAVVVTDSIGRARHITVDEDGDIYVALREDHNGYGIAALRDTTGNGIADIKEYFGDYVGTGIQLHHGYLYFGSDTSVVRYSMEDADLVPSSEPETIVSGFPVQNQHAVKPFTFDETGHIYVNVGGPSNACQEDMRTPGSPGMEPCPQLERQGGVWRFDANSTGQSQQEDGMRYTTGIRNAVALDWNTNADQLYVVQHGRDQLNTLWPDLYTAEENAQLPAEEFFKVEEGDHFGWPFTYYDQIKDEKMLSPEYGGDGETPAPEGEYEDPIMAFPGHWAPNDLIFYYGSQFPSKYMNGAFIAFHGSWNRAPFPQQGYNVVFVPFEGADHSGDWELFANNFAGADSLMSPGQAEYRPMGLAEGPQGSLFIIDSVQGRLWRVFYTGNL